MIYGSVCSGIEAASVAWQGMGWKAAYVADIEPFPCAVLAHRFGAGRPIHMPDPNEVGLDDEAARERRNAIKAVADLPEVAAIPNYGDFTRIADDAPAIDLLVGGTPCQAFSFAGQRQSLADARGNLTLEYVRLVHATKSLRYAVWENVPGVLSTDDNAFGCFLGGLVGADDAIPQPRGGKWPDNGMVAGPGGRAAWTVKDAQHFGLAQRRSRVFLVFCPAAAGGDPAAILFERKGVRGDIAPGRGAGQGIAGNAGAGAARGCGHSAASGDGLVQDIVGTLCADTHPGSYTGQDAYSGRLIPLQIAHTLRGEGFDASEDGTGSGTPLVPVAFSAKDYGNDATADLAPTLRAGGHTGSHANGGVMPAVAIPILEAGARTGSSTTDTRAGMGVGDDGDPMFTLQASKQHAVAFQSGQSGMREGGIHATLDANNGSRRHNDVIQASAVRRLTPTECERLQGFPDNHTLIPWRGKAAPDGPRYKALGNSMAVPVMRWIGERIQAYEDGTLDSYVWHPIPAGWASPLAAELHEEDLEHDASEDA
jgi:DNA (cytosine-5)-methyltransferase 1